MKYYHIPNTIRNASKNDLIITVMELLDKVETDEEELEVYKKALHILADNIGCYYPCSTRMLKCCNYDRDCSECVIQECIEQARGQE